MSDDPAARRAQLRQRYRHFADVEARGVSLPYETLARAVAESEALLAFVAALPRRKQQPNLVLAAVRHVCGVPRDGRHLAELVAGHGAAIRREILLRDTQTNEPARCATLLPVLARLRQPLALIEVGASAGLCLLPDRYGYDYGSARIDPVNGDGPAPPVFPCRASAATPIPTRVPTVAWRAGLDVRPVDVGDPEQAAWLEALVWPGQDARLERLRAAMRVARAAPPDVVRGDLVADLPALVAAAPRDATRVVFHSAVLPYVPADDRERFVRLVRALGVVWISNESPRTLPAIDARLEHSPTDGRFVLAMDGEPVALTGPHGQSIDWLA